MSWRIPMRRKIALVLTVGLSALFIWSSKRAEKERADLAALEQTDKAAWLARLRVTDEAAWWPALIAAAESDPDRFGAMLDEERKRRAFASQAKAKAEAARQCNDPYIAYEMAQSFVLDRLRSPATAQFPPTREIDIRKLDGEPCGVRVAGHVDSQNGFGAIVRSEWTVAMRISAETAGWRLEDIAVVDR